MEPGHMMNESWKRKQPLARTNDGKLVTVRFQDWECQILMQRYEQNGTPALQLVDEEGTVARATANQPGVTLPPGELLIKDYSENKGMLAALIEAGVVSDTGKRIQSEYAELVIATLAPEILEQWRRYQIESDGPSIG